MKKLLAILVLAGVVIGARFYWSQKQTIAEDTAPKLTTVPVELGPIVLKISTTGKVVANLDVEIKCKASGEIMNLPFDVSDSVNKGDLLVELDPIDEERNVKQAEIRLKASEAKLAQAKQNLLIAQNTLTLKKKRAEAGLISAQAVDKYAQAKHDLLIARKNLAIEKKRAAAALTFAKAHAHDNRTKANRIKQLLEKKLASTEEYETAETAAIKAATDLDLARIGIDELEVEELALNEKYEDAETAAVKAATNLDLEKIKIEELDIDEVALALKREDVKLAAVSVELDHIALTESQQRLKDTKVVSPMDGVVSSRNVQIGQIISSAISNVGGGTTVLILSDLSELFVLAAVDESDISKVALDQAALITTDAFTNKRFKGKVVQIATRGINTSNVITFEVKIQILGPDKALLKPEMTTSVEIISASKDEVLLVPDETIMRKQSQLIVEVAKGDGKTEERAIEIGISDGVITEITSGLHEGEEIVVRPGGADSRWRKSGRSNYAVRRVMRMTRKMKK